MLSGSISHNGKEYKLEEGGSGDGSYAWINENYIMAPQVLCDELNDKYIKSFSQSAVQKLDAGDQEELTKRLRFMNADEDTIGTLGLTLGLGKSPRSSPLQPASHGLLNNEIIRDWFVESLVFSLGEKLKPGLFPDGVCPIGSGPFDLDDLCSFLASQDIDSYEVHEEMGVAIIGRKDFEKDIDMLIEMRSKLGKRLAIYSQEMFMAHLFSRKDPFEKECEDKGESPSLLEEFKCGHPGLEFVSKGWPGWVTTNVYPGRGSGPGGPFPFGPETGPLKGLGYSVGANGMREDKRRQILTRLYEGKEEACFRKYDTEYRASWGDPETAERLKKIADSIATFCRNNKKKKRAGQSQQAIKDWESDLSWLKEEFYHGHYKFHWPFNLSTR